MPVFDINPSMPFTSMWHLVSSTMLYPSDEKKKRHYEIALNRDSFFKKEITYEKEVELLGLSIPRDDISIMGLIRDLKICLYAPSYDDILKDANSHLMQGLTAGMVIFYLFAMKEMGIQPSINKAKYLIEEGGIAVFDKKFLKGIPSNELYISRYWAKYKPTSHYWAAFLIHAMETDHDEVHFFMPESFTKFLALADYLRAFCEKTVADKVNTPILYPNEVYRLPEGFPLPEMVSPPSFENGLEWIERKLGSYYA